jgi:hypothetical protein
LLERWIEAELDRLPTFPCGEDKAALIPWKRARPNRAWREWIRVGVLCGKASGFDCVDFDDVALFNEWPLPASRTHQTQRGVHVLFRHHPGIRPSNGLIAPKIDVKGDDSYVIWHPFEGRQVWWKDILAPWPEWLLERALGGIQGDKLQGDKALSHAPNGAGTNSPALQPTRDIAKRSKHLLRILDHAPIGQRNDKLFFVACRFAEMSLIEKLLDRKLAERLLLNTCRRVWEPDLLQDRRTISSAFETIGKGAKQ